MLSCERTSYEDEDEKGPSEGTTPEKKLEKGPPHSPSQGPSTRASRQKGSLVPHLLLAAKGAQGKPNKGKG